MSQLEVQVSPTVVLSVADHRRRYLSDKDTSNTRVLGCLIGTTTGNTVHVTTSFPIPFSEARGENGMFYLDIVYQKKMLSLYQRVYHFEGVVGWYTSGTAIQATDLSIHEQFGFKNDPTKVLLCVDCTELGASIDAYRPCIRAYSFALINGTLSAHLTASKIMVSDVEKVVLSGSGDANASGTASHDGAIVSAGNSTFSTQLQQYMAALQILEEEINKVAYYIEERQGSCNPQILTLIQKAVNLLLATDITGVLINEHRAMACGYVVSELMRTIVAAQKVMSTMKSAE